MTGAMVDGSAAGGNPTLPTWWAKYQTVSAPGFKPAGNGTLTGSVSVGKNVDASNERGPQSETSIAINPSNPSQIVAGANEIARLPMRAIFSKDGGKTWGGVDLPLPPARVSNGFDFGSDPGIAWDTSNNVYYSFIVVFFSPAGSINGTEMAVGRSSDGGRTWINTYFHEDTGSAQFNDKPMITVDNQPGSQQGTVYVAWDITPGGAGGKSAVTGILISHSTDQGRTFSAPVFASAINNGPVGDIGADPFVGPDHTVYVAWHTDIGKTFLAVSKSTDGGQIFGPTNVIAPTQITFDIAIPSMNSRRALVYPACGADSHNTLFCSWMDGNLTTGTDIFVSKLTSGGTTWSPAMRVNDDPTSLVNDHFNQWLAVDPVDGSINLSWNDTRNDPSRLSTDIFYARSTNGGLSFAPNVQVTTAPTNETCCGADLGNQYGDYEGIAALGGSIHPVWTDRRASVAALDEEVFTATITTSTTTRHR
jgi:hypothetical protein